MSATVPRTVNRRSFLALGAAAAVSGAVPDGGAAPSATHSERPFVTCRKGKKLVGMYCSPNEVLNHPEYLDELQKVLGVNVVILHGCGVKYPPDILKLAPFPPEKKQWIGVGNADDDSAINRAAEILHSRKMDMWLSGSGHYDLGNDDTLSPVDFRGALLRNKPVPKYSTESGAPLCFQKTRLIEWQTAAYSWIAGHYDIDALYMSHHRYIIPALYTGLSGCACADCRAAAERLGFSFDRMRSSVLTFSEALGKLNRGRVSDLAEAGFGMSDFLQMAGGGDGVIDWLKFRAAAVADSFSRVNGAVHSASSGRCAFVIDTVGPTFSLLVGHDLSVFLGNVSDAYYPMAWVDHHYMNVIASWANFLCERADGLDEKTALRAVYRLVGWDDIDLPRERIADLHIGASGKTHDPKEFHQHFGKYLPGLMTHEYKRGRLLNVNGLPSYQTVFPYFWGRELTGPLMEEIMAQGHDGYFFEISAAPFVKKPGS